jgi:hypothetical protein
MIYNIPDHICGDFWIGIDNIIIKEFDIPVNLTDCEIYIQFRSDRNIASPAVLTLTTEDESITIKNPPLSGIISIPSFNLELPPENYVYDLQINFPSGAIKTYFGGKFSILPHTTRIRAEGIAGGEGDKLIITGDRKERILTSTGERLNYI